MQNRTLLVLLRPIFCEQPPPKGNWVPKLWSRCRDSEWKSVWISDFGRKISLNFGEDLFFFFWRPPVFGQKKRLNFQAFLEIPSQFSDKPCETDSRTMTIRVNVVCTFLTLSKKPPPFSNPGHAPEPSSHFFNKNRSRAVPPYAFWPIVNYGKWDYLNVAIITDPEILHFVQLAKSDVFVGKKSFAQIF